MPEIVVPSRAEPDPDGTLVRVTPESAGWGWVGFEVVRLEGPGILKRDNEGQEVCLVPLSGTIRVSGEAGSWEEVGGRKNVFDGLPHGLYLPPDVSYTVEATTGPAEVALCWSPAERGAEPLLVGPDDIEVERRGSGAFEREVRPILMADRPAEHLLVVEVITPQGHWSSYPPHKHDVEDTPRETYLEETYYHRLRPEGGFALQRVYSGDRSLDETVSVRDGDVVLVPRGYHTVSAPPGYDLYYLNVMAGPVREWAVSNDPDHEWLLK